MTDQHSPRPRERTYKHGYTPCLLGAAVTRLRIRSDDDSEFYNGTREELIAVGLVPQGMFPGDPGRPTASVAIYRMDAVFGNGWRQGGRLFFNRLPSGRLTLGLVVPSAESDRRKAKRKAEAEARQQAEQTELRMLKAEYRAGASLDSITARLGLSEVRAHVERLHRESGPRRPCHHLRLAWSAPTSPVQPAH